MVDLKESRAREGVLVAFAVSAPLFTDTIVAHLDHLKERIGYLKLWQSIVIAVDVSLLGWLVTKAQGR